MNLDETDLKLLHDIANRRALLQAPTAPLLQGTLAAAMRRRQELRAELTRLERQWLERGLVSAGLPAAAADSGVPAAPMAQSKAKAWEGPDSHHF